MGYLYAALIAKHACKVVTSAISTGYATTMHSMEHSPPIYRAPFWGWLTSTVLPACTNAAFQSEAE